MKIGFAGAGAVGSHYGSKLSQAGYEVLLLARGAHLRALQSGGLKHDSEGSSLILSVDASDDMNRLGECDVVVVSCKMTGLARLLESIHGHVPAGALLVTLQNGVEAPDMVAEAFPEHAVVAGTAFIGARLEAPGYVIHSAAGGVRMGLWHQGNGVQYLTELDGAFQTAGVASRIDADPRAMLWRKLLWNCGFNAITAMTRRYARQMAAHAETLQLVRAAMQETVALARAQGIAIDDRDINKHIAVTLAMGPVKTSMWQDLEAGRPCEVDYINGYVASRSAALGLAAPVNRMLTTLMHAASSSD
ncbi:MAG: 2-dehydropantoate 2-reductase [Mariprofundus sp.]